MSGATVLAFEPGTGFLAAWTIGLLVLAVVVVPMAVWALLGLVKAAAKLNRHTRVAMVAAADIKRNTAPAPQLAETLQVITEILDLARTAESHAAELEKVLGRPASSGAGR